TSCASATRASRNVVSRALITAPSGESGTRRLRLNEKHIAPHELEGGNLLPCARFSHRARFLFSAVFNPLPMGAPASSISLSTPKQGATFQQKSRERPRLSCHKFPDDASIAGFVPRSRLRPRLFRRFEMRRTERLEGLVVAPVSAKAFVTLDASVGVLAHFIGPVAVLVPLHCKLPLIGRGRGALGARRDHAGRTHRAQCEEKT